MASKQELALEYWHASQRFSKNPETPPAYVEEVISQLSMSATRASWAPWSLLEALAADRLQAVLEMRRIRKKRGAKNVVPLRASK